MGKLTIKLHGKEFAQLTLESGQEYIIGRAPDCSVVLHAQKGISRQHLKIFQADDVWYAESLSRFVPLQKDGDAHATIELKKKTVFYAPPYEFHFEETKAELVAQPPPQDMSLIVPKVEEPAPISNVTPEEQDAMLEDTLVRGNLEATVAGQVQLVPFLRVKYVESDVQEVLRLEGDLWIAGRDSGAEIPLRDSRVSRRHFEISRMREGFYVIDLGSANGTKLNGQPLPPHEPTKLESGDTISVLQIELTLEIHDTALASRMQQLPSNLPVYMPNPAMPPAGWNPAYPNHIPVNEPKPMKPEFNWKKVKTWKHLDYKKHKIRIALGALAPFLIYGALSGSGSNNGRNPASKDPIAFDKLTAEQKAAVKDTFSLSRNLYVQGKYELCLAELAKLHEMIPLYENSKELEAFCNQGKELVLRQKDIDRREKEKAMLEQQITSVVESCKEKLKDHGTVNQVRECLAPAMELNPEHPTIAEMIGAAQVREEENKLLATQRAARLAKMKKGELAYEKAKALYKKGELAKSIRAYDKFLNTTYPDLSKIKSNAQREVASIRSELNHKVATYLDQCRELGEKNNYKDAYLACDQALKEDPSHEQAKALQSKMLSNLRRELKSIYEDSVLEESLGNVDSAKEKWKKIIKEDLDFDEYSIKARTLLRKYGVEM